MSRNNKQLAFFADLFYKFAVSDYPPWIPLEFKNELEKIPSIEKDVRLKAFRVKVPNDFIIAAEYEKSLMGILQSMLEYIPYMCRLLAHKDFEQKIINEVGKDKFDKICGYFQVLLKTYKEFKKATENDASFLTALRQNKVKVGNREWQFPTFYGNVAKKYNRAYQMIPDTITEEMQMSLLPEKMEQLHGYQSWVNRNTIKETPISNMDIVFTTDYQDILGMSARSSWDSCQDISPESTWVGSYHAQKLLGSCISKHVGIIYITDGTDFEGRGERMFYRSAVWIVRDQSNNKDVLFVQKVYPDGNQAIKELFRDVLSKQLQMNATVDKTNLQKFVLKYKHQPYDDSMLDELLDREAILERAKENLGDYVYQITPEEVHSIIGDAINRNYKNIRFIDMEWDNVWDIIAKAFIDTQQPREILNILEMRTWFGDANMDHAVKLAMKQMDEGLLFKHYSSLFSLVSINNPFFKELVVRALKNGEYVSIYHINKEWEDAKLLAKNSFIKAETHGDIVGCAGHIDLFDNSWEEAPDILLKLVRVAPKLVELAKPEWGEKYDEIIIEAIRRSPNVGLYLLQQNKISQEQLSQILDQQFKGDYISLNEYAIYAPMDETYLRNMRDLYNKYGVSLFGLFWERFYKNVHVNAIFDYLFKHAATSEMQKIELAVYIFGLAQKLDIYNENAVEVFARHFNDMQDYVDVKFEYASPAGKKMLNIAAKMAGNPKRY